MKNLKRITALLCLLAIFVLPVSAAEATEPAALEPRMIGIWELEEIPDSWNPLDERSADQQAILSLTSEPLYRIADDGQVMPVQAAAMPEDVTAEFAGLYGIPANAPRGYAFAVDLREGTFWDDGRELTGGDWIYTIEMLLERDGFPLEIANYEAYRRGDTGPAAQIISLKEAGFNSVEEAEAAGFTDFYLETEEFWGLDNGWYRITDRTRLFDAAIPSGCEEMYVTPAYLYREYLSSAGELWRYQSRYVGIPVSDGEAMTLEDVGLLAQEDRMVLILEERTAPIHLALALTDLYPMQQGAKPETYGTAGYYTGCGQYKITSVSKSEILLEPNPYWTGNPTELELVRCTAAS